MKEYKLYQDGNDWVMEYFVDGKIYYATIGNSEMDCIQQMFVREFENLPPKNNYWA